MAKPPVNNKRKRRSATSTAEFKNNLPMTLRDAWLTMLSRFGHLLEVNNINVIEDAVKAHLEKNNIADLPKTYDQPFLGYTRFITQLSSFINRGVNILVGTSSFQHSLTMRKSPNMDVYAFRIGLPNWQLVFGPSSIPGAEHAFAAPDPFSVLINLFRDVCNIDFNKSVDVQKLWFGDDYEQASYHKDANVTTKGLIGLRPNEKSKSLLQTDVVRIKIDCSVVIQDEIMKITPHFDIEVDRSMYDNLVEYEGQKQEPLYLYQWMMQACNAASSATIMRRWKGNKIVDLRIVTQKLRAVKSNFGLAKPRVNSDKFAIGGDGLPLYLPEVDNCAEYVNDISKSTKIDDDGNYSFADSHLIWANRIILVEWFNDYVMYTDPLGYVKIHPLRGVRAMDAASEMMFLSTPVDVNKAVIGLLDNVLKLAADNVKPEEAAALLPKDIAASFGEDVPTVFTAYSSLISFGGGVNRSQDRSSFSNKSTLAFKHVLGLDLDELRDSKDMPAAIKYANVVRAYLRGLYKKRGKLDISVFMRLSGLEYMLFAAEKYNDTKVWKARKDEHSKFTQRLNADRLVSDSMDFPNLHIGPKNIQSLMPHQVKYLNSMYDGVQSGIGNIATGGGKGLISVLDLLQLMDQGLVKRPLLITKPGLVKENITEINRITKGKMNVVPLRTRTIAHMIRKAGLNTAKIFLDWIRNLPTNTIFVCAYSDFGTRRTFFEELEVPARALWYDVHLSQHVHLLRLLGIDGVYGDELHLIKNMESKRSICAYSVFAGAAYTRGASGMLTPNLPKDLVGEMYSQNPIIFGDNIDDFESMYSIRGGQIRTDDAARRIQTRMTELSRYFSADEEDWSFVLPVFKDGIVNYRLTPLQEEFYDHLLQEAMIEMQKREEEMNKKGKRKAVAADDDEDDEDSEDGDDDEDPDGDGAYIAALTVTLAKVEQFIVAPDANEEYLRWSKKPTGKDLISPAVDALDKYLDEHFKSVPEDRWAQEKVIVFSYHKVASVHFYKHSKWAKKGLHYTAGQAEVVRRLKTEDAILVMFADEGSLREGENLQMCSRIARMQPVWTPGDYKQAAARAYRPDPRGIYAMRENVRHDWFVAEGVGGRPTIHSVKLGTMISKTVNNARLKYENLDSFEWRKISPEFDELKRLRVNFDIVFNTDKEDIDPYMRKWGKFNNWIAQRVEKAKLSFAEELERKHNIDLIRNGKIIDMQQFLKLAMLPVTSTRSLPGSKTVYVPWEYNATPPDPHDLDLVVLGGQPAPIGSPVMTEFGAAIVLDDSSDRTLKVELYGGKKMGLRRAAVAIPGSENGMKRLKRIIKDKNQWKSTYQSPKIRASAKASIGEDDAEIKTTSKPGTKTKAPIAGQKNASVNGDEVDDNIEIYTQIVNGWPFLAISAEDAPQSLQRASNWNKIDPFVAYTFNSWNLADKFLDKLAEKFFINTTKFDQLVSEMEVMRAGRSLRLTSRLKDSEVRAFFMAQHRMKGKAKNGKFVIDPYWIAFEDVIYLCFDKNSHQPAVLNWLKRASAKIPGIKAAKPNDGFYVCQFKTMAEASEGVRQAAKLLKFDPEQLNEEIQQLKEDLKQFSARKERPMKTAPKATTKTVTKKPAAKAVKKPVRKPGRR